MATSFPAGLDEFQNPGPNDATENAVAGLDHNVQHTNANDAIEALQTKVGVNASAIAASLEYRLAVLERLFNLIPNEWATLPRDIVTSATIASTTQTLRLSFFTAPFSGSTTGVRIESGTTAAAATPTLVRLGLWTATTAGAGLALVASTVNDTTLLAAVTTTYARSWSAAYDMVAGQRYALGLLVVSAAAMPTVCGAAVSAQREAYRSPVITGFLSSQTNLPASWASGSLAVSGNRQYIVAT